MIQFEESWEDLASQLRSSRSVKIVYAVGASDRGKTTFCRYLSETLVDDGPIAYIDCDPGQSSLGPPTCIGMQQITRPGLAGTPLLLYFTGALSPKGHLLQNLCGVKKLTERAVEEGCRIVILDSSGFVLGNIAREFQFTVIDLVRPDFLVAFQYQEELEKLLQNFEGNRKMKIQRMSVPGAVKERSPLKRQVYRTERFREYFRDASLQHIRISGKGLHGMIPDFRRQESYENLLAGLCDAENFVSALGIIRAYGSKDRTLVVFAPPYDRRGVSTIHFGSVYLDVQNFKTFSRSHWQ